MRWPFLVALLGGCYSPSIAPCFLACAESACPDGLVCNSQQMCARSEVDVCSMGGPDAGDAVPSCGWPSISNVDPCALEADEATIEIDISAATASINTDTLASGGIDNLVLMSATQLGTTTGQVTVAVVRSWTLRQGSLLTIQGKRPLIILASEVVRIEGNILLTPSVSDPMCPTRGANGGNTTSLAGGGGGGGGGLAENTLTTGAGVGGAGGPYASNAGGSGGQPGDVGGAEDLRPLRPGCQGGRGGSAGPTPVAGGAGGFGGGAIQISAVDTIRVIGGINAPGGGGESGSIEITAPRSGAGGGGSGGAILLEAPKLELAGASLCANGGGGGGTGTVTPTGHDATCSSAPAPGGSGSAPNDGSGGNGATAGMNAQQGRAGSAVTGNPIPPSHGGGGGGGAVGRIRLNGGVVGNPMIVTPMPTTGAL